MKWKQIIFNQLDYDFADFSLDSFVRYVSELRQRRIKIIPRHDCAPELDGVLIRQSTTDYIFFNTQRHSILQLHIILHEVGHVFFNHLPDPYVHVDILTRSRSLEHRLDQQEIEAEQFSRIIQSRILRLNRIQHITRFTSSIDAVRQQIDATGVNI